MDEVDKLYLSRAEQASLMGWLDRVPSLAEDLLVTASRGGRVSRRGLKPLFRSKKMGSSLPYHAAAVEAGSALTDELNKWVKLCGKGRLELEEAAGYLSTHMPILAALEPAVSALMDISYHIKACLAVVDLPPDDEIVIDERRMREANRQVVSVAQIEMLARRLGDIGSGLNRSRVQRLVSAGQLTRCGKDGAADFYYLGEVLDAHFRAPRHNKAT